MIFTDLALKFLVLLVSCLAPASFAAEHLSSEAGKAIQYRMQRALELKKERNRVCSLDLSRLGLSERTIAEAFSLIPDELGTQTVELILAYNRRLFPGAGERVFLDLLPRKFPNLQRLILEGSGRLTAELPLLMAYVEKSQVTRLYLGECFLRDESLEVMLANLPALQKLTNLSLRGNSLGDKGTLRLLAIAAQLPKLSHLNLKETGCTSAISVALGELVANPASQLSSFDLSKNRLGDEPLLALIAGLYRRIKSQPPGPVREEPALSLDFSSTELSSKGAGELFRFLHDCGLNAQELLFENNPQIDEQIAEALSVFLENSWHQNSRIVLNLAGCSLGPRAGRLFGKSFAKNTNIFHLNLDGNPLGQGGLAILRGFAERETESLSQSLSLRNCGINFSANPEIFAFFNEVKEPFDEKNRPSIALDISENILNFKSLVAMTTMLIKNHQLQRFSKISFLSCGLAAGSMHYFADMMEQYRGFGLKSCKYGGQYQNSNCIHADDRLRIAAALAQSREERACLRLE